MRVNRQIVGFKEVKFYTNENIGAGMLSLPEQEMHTTTYWLHFPAEFLARFTGLTPTEKLNAPAGLGSAFRSAGSIQLVAMPTPRKRSPASGPAGVR